MRNQVEANGVAVKAYAGTTGVLLGLNIDPARRPGLLGFALQRFNAFNGNLTWLKGMLHFPGQDHRPGEPVESRLAPIQRFRWSDYTVYPDSDYTYTVHPVYGSRDQLRIEPGPAVAVRTESLRRGEQRVIFNRAVAASQAFARRFSGFVARVDEALRAGQPVPDLPPEAEAWLTRGLLDEILAFIGRAADANWALDIGIYEYELRQIVRAVEAARQRGAEVRLVYHAKPGDDQTRINALNASGLPPGCLRARLTSRIFHDKFIVLSRLRDGVRYPQAVLCGSTNFTSSGVFRQANVVHMLENPEIAGRYLELFELLFGGADVTATRAYVDRTNPIDPARDLQAAFSPRSGLVDLQAFIREVGQARRDLLFCTAFDLYDPLEEALKGRPHDQVLRYGLQNSRSRITGFNADRTAEFAATALYSRGLEGWLKESLCGQRGRILIHTKIILVDFTSDAPVIISGSHNLSKAASQGNDENYLILRGDLPAADTYGCEVMRLFDHYRFRFHLAERIHRGAAQVPLVLAEDDSWTEKWFGGDPLKTLDRVRFSGAADG